MKKRVWIVEKFEKDVPAGASWHLVSVHPTRATAEKACPLFRNYRVRSVYEDVAKEMAWEQAADA